MPLFKIDIQKFMLGEYWTNRWLVNADDLLDAQDAANDLVTHERFIHSTIIRFDRVRVSDAVQDTDVYVTIPLNVFGNYGFTGENLPLFNVLRADFNVAVGRPCRKYWRVGLSETYVVGSQIAESVITDVNNVIASIVALGRVVDPQGNVVTGGSAFPAVQMRQLRRGSRRRTNPVI